VEPFAIVAAFLRAPTKRFRYTRHALERAGERGAKEKLPEKWKGRVYPVRVHELNTRTGRVKVKIRVGKWTFIAEVGAEGEAEVITTLGVRR